MPALLTAREKELFERARSFALTHIAPHAAQWEAARKLPSEAVALTQQHGFFGVGSPVELGGKGYNYLETALTYEGLAHGDGGFAFFVQLHNNIVFEAATFYEVSDLVRSLTPDLVCGNKLAAFALTDDEGGSDPLATGAYAEEKEDGFHLFGDKSWVSNSIDAAYFTTIVKDGTEKGMVMLLVPRNIPGFEVKEDIQRIGGNVMSCGRIHFENAIVPKEYLLSRDGLGEALRAINVARIFVPAIAVGIAQRALDITAQHLGGRIAFGKPLIKNQALQFELAEMSAEVEAARWLVYHAASARDAGEDISILAAKNKLYGPDVAQRITCRCAQMFGAKGCEWDSEISRCANMGRVLKVLDGTSEVQQIVIGKSIARSVLPPR